MDRYLKPVRFDCDPNAAGADKEFKHWLTTFKNFAKSVKIPTAATPSDTPSQASEASTDGTSNTSNDDTDHKLTMLINYLAANVYEYIADCTTFDQAIETLTGIYIKPINEIYARYKLASRKQADSETLDTYIQELHRLSKDCNFKEVSAEQHRQGHVRDAFVSGIRSKDIRQKIIESASQNASVSMDQIFDQARTLQMAQKNAESYTNNSFSACATTYTSQQQLDNYNQMMIPNDIQENDATVAAIYSQNGQACFFCGSPRHARRKDCPAYNHKCQLCGKMHHWERVCHSSDPNRQRHPQPFQRNRSMQRNMNSNNSNNNN